MTFSIKRVRAIMVKDWKNFLKNYYILTAAILPLGMAFLLKESVAAEPSMATLLISMALAMTGSFVQASMMAEEKEKNTLRVLLLSPTTTTELMIGKSILTGIITLIIVVLSCILSGTVLPNFFISAVIILLLLVFFLALGTIVGLLSKSITEASVVAMPVILIFTYGSFVTTIVDSQVLKAIFNALPTELFTKAYISLSQGGGFTDIKEYLLYILLWTVATVALTFVFYKKRRFDH